MNVSVLAGAPYRYLLPAAYTKAASEILTDVLFGLTVLQNLLCFFCIQRKRSSSQTKPAIEHLAELLPNWCLVCVFHAISITDSMANRSPIPAQFDHPFHGNPISDSTVNRSLIA